MAVKGLTALTLADWGKRVDPNGKVDKIIELLGQTNPILQDMPFVEGNLPTGHRTVNGQTVRYIERLSSRLFTSDEDAFFVDSGLSYDGRNTSDRTMTITGGSGEWDYRAEYTISVSGGAYFTSSDVGAQLQFPYTGTDPDTGDEVSKELRCDIISVTSNTAVVVRANRNVPPSLRNVATTNWQMARRTFGGLSHLEDQHAAHLR
jgi:hypothetical protein